MIGSTPDLRNATQAAIPTSRYAGPYRTLRALMSTASARNPSPITSGTTWIRPLYTTAMTAIPARSSTTEKVSR